MINNTFFKPYLGIIFVFLCFFITCCKTSTINVTGEIHLNPIAEIFSGLDVSLPSSVSRGIEISKGEKEKNRRNVRKYSKMALRRDKKNAKTDLVYGMGMRRDSVVICGTKQHPQICPCQTISGSNQFLFVEANDNNYISSPESDKFSGMALIVNRDTIDLPMNNITINNIQYKSFALNVADYQSFPNNSELLIFYKPSKSGYTFQYKFKITYEKTSNNPYDGDGMAIFK